MKSVDLYKAIKLGGFTNAQLTISDVDYALPKASWLTGTFYDFYKNWRWEHNLNEWSNKNDCVAGFEKVVTPIGPKVISDLKDGDVVLTYNFLTNRQEFAPIINVTNKGHLNSYSVQLKNHASFVASDNHPIFFKDRAPWKRRDTSTSYSVDTLSNVISKMSNTRFYVPCASRIRYDTLPSAHTADEFFILGHFIAEGWVIRNDDGTPKSVFTSGHDIDTDIIPVLNRLEIRFYYHKNNSGVPYIRFASDQSITKWLASFKDNSVDMRTSALISESVENIKSFLDGHWIGDGHKQNNYIVHSTSSDDLAQTIVNVYGKLGTPALKYYQANHMGAGSHPIWRVMVNEKSNFTKDRGFADLSETHIKSITSVGKVECFDFSTPNGNYFLENGALLHNCDNFASLFYAFAQICHAKSNREEQGIAVGELFYFIGGDKTKGHAINIALTDKGIIAIEPQNGRIQELTKAEKESAWFVRF